MKTKSIIGPIFLLLLVVLLTSFVIGRKLVNKTSDSLQIHLNRPNKIEKNNFDDRKSIQNNIKNAFLIWSQKDEFEKQKDYESRIQKQSKNKFTEICIDEIEKKIMTFTSSDLNINLLKYDAENEFFPAVFKFKESECKIKLEILINEAQNFKENEWQKLEWQIEESAWCFIYNDLFPSKIYLKSNKYEMIFKVQLPNQEDIVIAFNDLRIENLNLKDFIFNYSKTKNADGIKASQGSGSFTYRAFNNTDKKKSIKPTNSALNSILKGPKPKSSSGNESELGDEVISGGSLYADSFYGYDAGLAKGTGWGLTGRKLSRNSKKIQDCNESGKVVVKIWVNRQGNVVKAERTQGTTNNNPCLVNPALETAKTFKFQPDANAPETQIGFIVVNFQVGE